MYSFEHITCLFGFSRCKCLMFLVQAPYQTKLIDLSLLIPEEINWLNSYHSKCRDILAPYLDEAENAWLKKATEPIAV